MPPQVEQSQSVNPDMITLARESRGLSQKSLADTLGIAHSRLSMIEMGLRPVSEDLLEQLASILHYPRHFFTQEGKISGVGITEVFHRKRQNVPKYVLTQIYAQIEIRIRHIAALLRSVEVTTTLPQLDADDYNGDAAEVARAVRASLQIPRGPIDDLTETLEFAGVIVIPFHFGTRLVDAISRWIPTLPPLMFVNQDSPKDRYRFSTAHELGHLVLHSVPNPDMEEQADRFAAELLMPERQIGADLQDLNLAQLTVLKRYWKVSMAALLKRAQDLGSITPNRARYLWAQMAKAGYKTREPIELDVTGESPRFVHELIALYRKELGYSLADLGVILPLDDDELWEFYLQPTTGDKRLRAVGGHVTMA
jgi:Zn-dependent peptidase ImmA (M78 family)/transcriptional regulator with XRE-family HTH domain